MPAPSQLALVPFISVENMMRFVLHVGLERVLIELAGEIEADFRRWERFDKTPRVASHSAVGVIELMPTSDGEFYGFKYVNGHPKNMAAGLQTVTAFGVLADVATGYPLLLSEMTMLTALRTAATSAMAAKHLAPKGATHDGDDRQRRAVGVSGVRVSRAVRHRACAALRHRSGGDREVRGEPRRHRLARDAVQTAPRRRWKARRSSRPAPPTSSSRRS